MDYNVNFEKLFEKLGLGMPASEPHALSGGLLHKVFAVESSRGKYAVKALNPQIIIRPGAMNDYIASENISFLASKYISAVTAKRFNDTAVQEYDGQYYLVYPFVYGKSLNRKEIGAAHCAKMGATLALLHKIDFSPLKLVDDDSVAESPIDWESYLQSGLSTGAEWADIMKQNFKMITHWSEKGINAAQELRDNTVISHGDMESKNVLWQNGIPHIIDWESADYVNPAYDLLETAIYWSGNYWYPDVNMKKENFMAFISAYLQHNNIENPNWQAAFAKCLLNKLGWLEYNLKRSLGIESIDEADRNTGTQHIFYSIEAINRQVQDADNCFAYLKMLD